jgi:GTP cyclohydrolase II
MTNNPDKVDQLTSLGIDVVERIPLIAGVSEENKDYLGTKASRMGHTISDDYLGSI